jgi:type 1 fimbria pilin
MNAMKIGLLLGLITLAYGMSSSAFASDSATLTISGRVTEPTCSADVVNNKVQQRCGIVTLTPDLHEVASHPVRGVVTELVPLGRDATRQIVLSRYD